MQGGGDVADLALELARELERRAERLELALKDIVAEVTRSNFDEVTSKYKIVFLFFTADWCGPCVSFLKTFREVASANIHPNVFYGRVDVDKSYTLADKFDVRHIPSIVILVDGKVVETIIGSVSRQKLEEKVRQYIKLAGG